MLSSNEKAGFLDDGYIVIRQCFDYTTAEELLSHVWARVKERRNDPSTWTRQSVQIEELIEDGPIDSLLSPRFNKAVDALVGKNRWITSRGFGWVLLRFPGFANPPWHPPSSGWHIDGMNFHHHLTSREQGLVGIEMLTDVESGGGGTSVRIGSHQVIARELNKAEPLAFRMFVCVKLLKRSMICRQKRSPETPGTFFGCIHTWFTLGAQM